MEFNNINNSKKCFYSLKRSKSNLTKKKCSKGEIPLKKLLKKAA